MAIRGQRERRHLISHQNKDIRFAFKHRSGARIESGSWRSTKQTHGERLMSCITIAVHCAAVKRAKRYEHIRGTYAETGSFAADAGAVDVRVRRASRQLHRC